MQDAGLPDRAIPFAKMNGSGNDFVVIDNRNGVLAGSALPRFTRQVCRRGLGLGADGVVTIEPVAAGPGEPDFRWRYLNADGSDGEMCGNGAMCGARFAVMNGIAPRRCVFQTPSGLVRAEIDPGSSRVTLAMVDSGIVQDPVTLELAGRVLTLHPVRVGVPHVVAFVDDADGFAGAADFAELGRAVRFHDRFAPAGTNVNIVSRIDHRALRMRTYERGVEAETLACGTGSVATAIVAHRVLGMPLPLTIRTSSGRPLDVGFDWDEVRQVATEIRLTGEARVVATGELDPEGWLDA
ncbi:MAG TPA: diaminopimelate epimerase [Thermomicrobiales bacterium]|nr:diaminopimelate epimerase [Thermomicrobiales bacterium]